VRSGATVWTVADRRAHPGRLLAVPVMAAAWANLHGSFFLAPMLLGLAWLEDVHARSVTARRTLTIGIVSAGASLLNPFGLRVWTYAFDISTNRRIATMISEWQSPTIRTFVGVAFFASGLAVAGLVARRVRSVPWPSLLFLGF